MRAASGVRCAARLLSGAYKLQRACIHTFSRRSLLAACSSRRCCSIALRLAFQAVRSSSVIAASFAATSARFASFRVSLAAFSAALRSCFFSWALRQGARSSRLAPKLA